MTLRICRIVALATMIAGITASVTEAVTVTPRVATISLTAHAGLDSDLTKIVTTDAEQSGVLHPVHADVLAVVATATRRLSTGAQMTATFLSAAHGRIVIADAGWRGEDVAQGLYAHASLRGSAGFSYGFSIDAPTQLSVSFDIRPDATSTDLFGLQGLRLRDLGHGISGEALTNAHDPTLRRTITRDLAPGTYTLGLGIESNISGLPGSRISLMDATIEWSLGEVDWSAPVIEPEQAPAPVPLPPTLAMVCGTLGSIFLLRGMRRFTRSRAP